MRWAVPSILPEVEVSDTGLVRCLVPFAGSTGQARKVTGDALKTRYRGQYLILITQRDGVRKYWFVHRLVCSAFNGPAPKGRPLALHRNGDSRCNTPENIYWGSPKDNMDDRARHGRKPMGDDHKRSKIRAVDVPVIRARIAAGEFYHEIGKDYGVGKSAIYSIKKGMTWAHI